MRALPLLMLALLSRSHVLAGEPSSAGSVPPVVDDEKRLWLRSEEEEKKLDSSGMVYRNAEIDGYLDSVVRKLIPAEQLLSVPISVRIIRDRSCNAFTFPNGRIYIHSGMLAAMENEAQLATLLGHESVHALNRHQLKELRDSKDKIAVSAVFGALTGNVLTPFGMLAALSSISGYSRDMESEADREGFRMLARAGYDPSEAPKVFIILQKEAQAEKKNEPYFFASHPKLQERIDSYEAMLKAEYADRRGGSTDRERFLRILGPLLLDNAEMDVKAGRYESARGSIGRYHAGSGDSARAYFLLGETCRHGGQKEDASKATEYYLKAVTVDPAYPDPHRILGLLAYKRNDREQARKYLERYLELSPSAPDRGYIEAMLNSLR